MSAKKKYDPIEKPGWNPPEPKYPPNFPAPNPNPIELNRSNAIKAGEGDDGLVVRLKDESNGDVAFKIFNTSSGNKSIDDMRKDQAYREFKALKLITNSPPHEPHPNFLTLFSENLEMCNLDLGRYYQWKNCLGIRVNYIPDLKYLDEVLPFMGVSFDVNDSKKPIEPIEPIVFNFEHRNQILIYMVRQMFLVLLELNRLNIRHRDLDTVNIKIQFPEFKLCVFDFARADLPNSAGFENCKRPESIIEETIQTKKHNEHNLEICTYSNYEPLKAISKDCESIIKSYTNPLFAMLQLLGEDTSDFSALKVQYRKLFDAHIKFDFGWTPFNIPSGQKDKYFEIENIIIGSFIETCWNPDLDYRRIELNEVILHEALKNVKDIGEDHPEKVRRITALTVQCSDYFKRSDMTAKYRYLL